VPATVNIDEVFWHRERRTVRRDNTLDIGGQRYELATMGLAGRRVEVRFDPNDVDVPPRVFDDGVFVCDTRPIDLRANATGRRRRRQTLPEPVRDPVDAVQDLLDAHYGTDEDDRGGAR
jgi:hypothetical protein